MLRFLKQGRSAAGGFMGEQTVYETVRDAIQDVKVRGDAAVREMSEKFDRWSEAGERP
ncbi:hypothetical protein [Paenibacillus sp. HJGM_3]|uniref:hypothetical protein n=1 Tax=Paenibacillus sp. HJGM_3 TaxID=3379816 RepID=UPI003858AD12